MSIKDFIESNRQNMIDDIKALVNIRSVKSSSEPGAPYGVAMREVQQKAMDLCEREGFEVEDADGIIAFAHYGPTDRFIGVFAHLDIVPEGDGWDTPPFDCREREGFLVGRGVADNKGPFVMGLYALKYLKETCLPLNYGVRLLIGLDEESGMSDAEYYAANYPSPVFTFTPDSDFPVCHGEKGICSCDLISGPLGASRILELDGGIASNVVPDYAGALVDPSCKTELLSAAEGNAGVKITETAGGTLVEAFGVSAHAGTPFKGVSAINILLKLLQKAGALNENESAAADFLCSVAGDYSGKALDIDCDDGKFIPLTVIAGTINKARDKWTMNINIRYPTAITPDELEKRIESAANGAGFSVQGTKNMPPFYLEPELEAIKLLSGIYNELTGSNEKPYLMSGGTYARKLQNAVAFGPEIPGREYPEWVGTAHMKNEAISINDVMLATEIYTEVLIRLQNVEM